MQELIPITLFLCLAYAIQAVADARARGRLIAPHISEEVIASILQAEQSRRRLSSLRWGISLLAATLGLLTLEAFGWDELTPGFAAVLTGSIALGQLAFYVASVHVGRSQK